MKQKGAKVMRKSDVIMMVLPDGEILPMEQAKDYCNLTIEKGYLIIKKPTEKYSVGKRV